jgi:hypothetical protein
VAKRAEKQLNIGWIGKLGETENLEGYFGRFT